MTTKQLQNELTTISKLSSVSKVVKALNELKSKNEISGFGKFKDGINVYKKNDCEVIFEIKF